MTPVGVPQPLYRFGPVRNLLNLVEHQNEAPFRAASLDSSALPLMHQPPRASLVSERDGFFNRDKAGAFAGFRKGGVQGGRLGLVHCQITVGCLCSGQDLLYQRGLARLARSGDDDEPSGRLAQACEEDRSLRAFVGEHVESIRL